MNEEIWKDLNGFDLPYQVSNIGNVKCLAYNTVDVFGRKYFKDEHNLSLIKHQSGYIVVNLRKNGSSTVYKVHRLVAKAFIDNPDNKPTVDHIDGDKTNNNVSNLRWCTLQENKRNPNTFSKSIAATAKSCKSRIKKVYQLDSNYNVIGKYDSAEEAAKAVNCSSVLIHRCCNIHTRTAKGYHWSYSPFKIKWK